MVDPNMTQVPSQMPVNESGVGGRKKMMLAGGAVLLVAVLGAVAYFGLQGMSSANYEKGVAAYKAGNFEEAKGYFEKASAQDQKDPLPYYYLGEIALGKSAADASTPLYSNADYASAIRNLAQAVSLDIKNGHELLYADALNDLGYSYFQTKDYTKANEVYLEHIAFVPDQAYSSRYFVALNDVERFNKPEEALDVLLPALSAPDNAFKTDTVFRVHALLARLYLYNGDLGRAAEHAQHAIEGGAGRKGSEIEIAHTIRALAYGQQKNFKAAEGEITAANTLRGSAAYNCLLAAAYANGKDYKKAGETIKKITPAYTYDFSHCQMLALRLNRAAGKLELAKKDGEYYMQNTGKFPEKNIFVVRNRDEVAEFLKSGK